MGLPGKRLSRSSKRRRAAHFALKKQALRKCEKCAKNILPHRACPYCGIYKGRVALVTKLTKKFTQASKKQREKQEEE